MEKLIVSSSPHIHVRYSTQSIMRDVLIALTPAAIASVIFFGIRALLIIATCVATAMLSEFLFNFASKKQQTLNNMSAAVTGLILALSLPAKTELWQAAIGAVFAIVIVKCFFGGLGCNFANPAATGRVFLLLAFSLTVGGGSQTIFSNAELVSSATPLEIIKLGSDAPLPSITDMLIGNRGGAIGETCAIALVIGGIYLIARRIIHWHTPVIYLGTVFLLSLAIKQDVTAALYQLLGGGVIIAAFFMITDYVTTPINKVGKAFFAFCCGILTVILRFWGSYPEGVSFAILIMNIVTPYIERLCAYKPLGKAGVKNEKK